ncbi:LicD family protein [Thalassotalea nanhaiensis]|uniref:LicD family protein n=1 Tax=Thalassotalea nanhaiensis TaxID=3065648 RepID=A0ABY9TGM3_9GAMM|nr:LicD family protein [Colwelliaceae bacterium SQ345]
MDRIKEIQQVQLQILKQVLSVINQHNLSYIAVGGTALGALRHQGFIPWDDDIDIAMPRADYDIFLKLQDELPEQLFIQNFKTDKHYPLYFTKVRLNGTLFVEERFQNQPMHHGIFIDIFPLDTLDINESLIKSVKTKENIFRRLVKKSYKSWLYKFRYSFKTAQQAYNDLEDTILQHQKTNGAVIGSIQANDIFKEENLFPITTLPFEDIDICVPNNIEQYLEDKFGDYMRIPQLHERKLHKLVSLDFGNTKATQQS